VLLDKLLLRERHLQMLENKMLRKILPERNECFLCVGGCMQCTPTYLIGKSQY
jgi:hypothetical protein